LLLTGRPARSPLFPYTTLFRSGDHVLRGLRLERPRAPNDRGALLHEDGHRDPRAGAPPRDRELLRDLAEREHRAARRPDGYDPRSEEHTSELQSRSDLVCRLLL